MKLRLNMKWNEYIYNQLNKFIVNSFKFMMLRMHWKGRMHIFAIGKCVNLHWKVLAQTFAKG